MRIGIIGRGRVGTALSEGWVRAGHKVRLEGRSPDNQANPIGPWAEVIVLAVPHAALADVAARIGPLAGKVVIDCTNPIPRRQRESGLSSEPARSGGEAVQALLPEARVVKTLNQVGAEVMADTAGFPHSPVQFLAGDDDNAKVVVTGLLTDLGFEPLDAGALDKARLLEPFAMVWINQALARGKGRNWAFGAMVRGASGHD